ncbi:MAG: hypothetical protein MJ066_01750 [Clostridia bacterium]|nr:hypothetical protein [Clostridia bacterium]
MKCTSKVPVEVITPEDNYNYFFGYYDLQPFDKKSERHLTHRTSFCERMQTEKDIVEIGYITIKDKTFHKITESRAWNFQQGTLLQWYDDDSIIYNDYRNGDYCSVIKNITTGAEKIICKPLAHVSADRKWGLSINFPRVYDFRPGYGYCNTKDKYYDVFAPEEDGIFLVDIEKNTAKLIVNYKQLKETFPEKPFADMKIVVNHITFNPSASRFLFLLRNFPEEGKKWGTILVTCDRDGKNMRNLTNYEVNSHYHWKNDEEIIIYSGLPKWGIYFMNDKTGERSYLNDDLVNYDDIHCIYSPDRTCFIGDGYPDKEDYRHIFLYDFESKKSTEILKIYSEPVCTTDIRCDLHNRFNLEGNLVSFDSYHSGRREICLFKFDKKELMK